MAEHSHDRDPITGDDLVDVITSGWKWTGEPVYWSTSNGFGEESEWGDLGAKRQELRLVFDTIDDFIGMEFEERRHYSDPVRAGAWNNDITVSPDTLGQFTTDPAIWALGFFPTAEAESAYIGQPGDIYVNMESEPPDLPTYRKGSQGFFLFLHEVGHALGLKHPFDNGGDETRPTLESLGLRELDGDLWSMMSYGDDRAWTDWSYDPATPLPLDVIGLQHLYGKNMSTNRGDTVHELGNPKQYAAIWDAGGDDTVSVADSDHGWQIRMTDGVLSETNGERWGHALPTGQQFARGPTELVWLQGDYEAVVGSRFRDVLQGSDLSEVIEGGRGDDRIDGGAGDDTASGQGGDDRVSGQAGDDVLRGGGGSDRVLGGGGEDVLRGGGGGDRLAGGVGADTARGGAGDDRVAGGRGDDLVVGGAGDDLLIGGRGDDMLRGGGGEDVFRFTLDGGDDVVRDFALGVDLVEIPDIGGPGEIAVTETPRGALLEFGEASALLVGIDVAGLDLDQILL